jgi:hypothetical protein
MLCEGLLAFGIVRLAGKYDREAGLRSPSNLSGNRILAQSKRRELSKRSDCVFVLIVDIEQRLEAAHA